jgi:hypothetical protein
LIGALIVWYDNIMNRNIFNSLVRVQDVTTWVSENVGETMQSKRRREFPRSQPQKPGTETAELLADTG